MEAADEGVRAPSAGSEADEPSSGALAAPIVDAWSRRERPTVVRLQPTKRGLGRLGADAIIDACARPNGADRDGV